MPKKAAWPSDICPGVTDRQVEAHRRHQVDAEQRHQVDAVALEEIRQHGDRDERGDEARRRDCGFD